MRVTWPAYVLYGVLVAALLVFGGVADYALLEQARANDEAARSELAAKAQMMARSVGAALGQAVRAVAVAKPWSGVSMGRLANPRYPPTPLVTFSPYLERSKDELLELLASSASTPNGLPEAVVAAVALGREEAKSRTAERLLSGLLPVQPEDLPYLAVALGVDNDARLERLDEQLRRARKAATRPTSHESRRLQQDGNVIQGWLRKEDEVCIYEIPVDLILNRAGLSGHASLIGKRIPSKKQEGTLWVPVPDVDDLTLVLTPEVTARMRIRALRLLLWFAVVTSVAGITVVVRAWRTETRALAREKAFLASVTHELRTPLAAVRLFGETLSEGRGDPREYGAMVARESERLEALVERVLSATRVEEQLTFQRLDPAEVVRSAVALIADRAEKRTIQLVWDESVQSEPLPEVSWDFEAVRRALLNLLDNAVTHGKDRGRVELRAAVDGDAVRLSVADDGPGIGPRDSRKIFGRFQRGATDAPGTGLGLYVVEQVARAHGGRVDLQTEEGRGATFTLVLPIEPGKQRRPAHDKGSGHDLQVDAHRG